MEPIAENKPCIDPPTAVSAKIELSHVAASSSPGVGSPASSETEEEDVRQHGAASLQNQPDSEEETEEAAGTEAEAKTATEAETEAARMKATEVARAASKAKVAEKTAQEEVARVAAKEAEKAAAGTATTAHAQATEVKGMSEAERAPLEDGPRKQAGGAAGAAAQAKKGGGAEAGEAREVGEADTYSAEVLEMSISPPLPPDPLAGEGGAAAADAGTPAGLEVRDMTDFSRTFEMDRA